MASSLTVNDAELRAALIRLERSVSDKVRVKAVRAAGQPIRTEARRRVPVREGKLRDSIKVRTSFRRRFDYARALVGARAPHGHLVEFGTEPHLIPIPKGRRRYNRGRRYWRHPGAKPHPYLGPAFEARKSEAVTRARAVLARAVQRAAARRGGAP